MAHSFAQGGRSNSAFANQGLPMAMAFQPTVGGAPMRVDPRLQPQPAFNGTSHGPLLQMHPQFNQPAYLYPQNAQGQSAAPTFSHLSPQGFVGHMAAGQPSTASILYPNFNAQQQNAHNHRQNMVNQRQNVASQRQARIIGEQRRQQLMREGTGETTTTQVTDEPPSSITRSWSIVSAPTGARLHSSEQFHHLPAVRLKGRVLPGMRGFDAATPEQVKKRNQKKSIEQYERLEATSDEIYEHWCLERIFEITDEDWKQVKQRVITGHPTPSSIASSPPASRPSSPAPPARSLRTRVAAPRPRNMTTANTLLERDLDFGVPPRDRPFNPYFDYEDEGVLDEPFEPPRPFSERRRHRRQRLADENDLAGSLNGANTAK